MNKNKTYEVSIEINSDKDGVSEILSGVLYSLGFMIDEVTELKQWGKSYLLLYCDTRPEANLLKKKILQSGLKHIEVSIKSLKEEEWLTKWKREFKPFMLTSSIKIIPSWLKDTHKTNKMPIYIDTGVAFGTGLHATTRFMAGFVEKCKGEYRTFLDIGTGTGILAIIANKLGAEHVDGLDISMDAINVARENFAKNKASFNSLKAQDFLKYKALMQYDFVAANLITHDLIAFKDKIVDLVNPGGYLAVSGISINNYSLFRDKFKFKNLRCVKIEKSEGWCAVLFKKVN